MRSGESKKGPKICKHQQHPQPALETCLFCTHELQLYCSGAVIYTLTFPSVHLQKSLLQETTQYLEFIMLLHDVISIKMIRPVSKCKQYFLEGVDLNPGYTPVPTRCKFDLGSHQLRTY